MDKPLSGLSFVLAGPLSRARSNFELQELIRQNGGSLQENVDGSTTHVISSLEMINMLETPYKLQFFPNLEDQLTAAQRLKKPIVDELYVDKCIKAERKVDEAAFLLNQKSVYSFDSPYFQQPQESQPSKLDERVQDLVRLLFDRAQMERALSGLGLNARQCMDSVTQNDVRSAYSVLSEVEGLLGRSDPTALASATQRLARLIPHATPPPAITTSDALKQKLSMLDALGDIVIAAELMRGEGGDRRINPIDLNYNKLKTKLTPLEKYSQEFEIISQYAKNTHAHSHSYFTLDIQEVYSVEREGEAERFEPFKSLPHHRLLWHGSRLTNYIGILSQGLRIAPKEAPSTGYFLGKGIYFADMVSKSAEYCHAKDFKEVGLLMLADVALGRPFQVAHGKFVSKEDLDGAGFHSVKGVGEKAPDAACDLLTKDGLIVPLGHETDAGVIMSELEHNEYIVYDVDQVNIKYLIKFNFSFPEQRHI